MSLLANKNLFFGLFSLLLLLSFLLAETYVGFYVLGAFSVLLLLFRPAFPIKKTIYLPIAVVTLLLWLFFAFSLLGSISLPLSFYSLTRYTFLFAFFLFFLMTDFSKEDKKLLFQLLLFQGISLVFVSTLFFLLPNYGSRIPGMNVIFSTYGHNHLGAIMLLLNPIAFWLYLTEKKPMYFGLFLLFSASIIMSFGRVVIFVGLIQLALIAYLYAKSHKIPLRSPIGVSLVALCTLFALGLTWYVYSGRYDVCLVEDLEYQDQVCKSDLRKNVRHFYWQQGWQAFSAKPWFGYGIGTFGLISYQYRQIPEFHSSYAHNDYLQIFAESGVFAGLLFVVWLGLLYRGAWHNIRNSSKAILLLSLVAVGVDFFFDFDFHFFGIALLTLMVFALTADWPLNDEKQIATNKLKPLVTIMLMGVLLVAGFYVVTDRLITTQKESAAYNIFPLFHWHGLNFMRSDQLSAEKKAYLADVYWASPLIQTHWLTTLDGDQKAAAEYRTWTADPWRRMSSSLPQYYFEEQDVPSLEKVLLDTTSFLEQKREKLGFYKESIPTISKERWAQQFIFLAEQKFIGEQYGLAAEYIKSAHYYDEWSLVQPISFLTDVRSLEFEPAMRDFLEPLMAIPVESFGDNRDPLAWLYFQQTKWLLNSGDNDELMRQSTVQVLKLAEWGAQWFQAEVFPENFEWSKLIKNEKWDEFARHALVFHAIRTYQYQTDGYYDHGHFIFFTQRLIKPIQQYIDFQFQQGNREKAGKLLNVLARGMSGMYWIQAQRGYFYGLIEEYDMAKEAFNNCLAENPTNDECRHGLQNLQDKGEPDNGRYEEIRQILLEL